MRRVCCLPLLLALLAANHAALGADDFFWEMPSLFSGDRGTFPQTASGGGITAVAWQEAEPRFGGGRVRINLAVRRSTGNGEWLVRQAVAGPYAYASAEPSLFTLFIDDRGRIFIAAAVNVRRTEIFVSDNDGMSFTSYPIETASGEIIAPKLFQISSGYLLFATRRTPAGTSLFYARSTDGLLWSNWEPFITDPDLQFNFLPAVISTGGRVVAVFQSFLTSRETAPAFHLFVKISEDEGRTWSPARLLSGFQDPAYPQASFMQFNNERAHLSLQNGVPFVVWERRYANNATMIYGATLGIDGAIAGVPFRINKVDSESQNPITITADGDIVVLWFAAIGTGENRVATNAIYMARHSGYPGPEWEVTRLSWEGNAVFGRPLFIDGDLFVFWQRDERIYLIQPDHSVDRPILAGGNFVDGRPAATETAFIRWRAADDSSGVAGFSYLWSRIPGLVPPTEAMLPAEINNISELADADGAWYFTLRSMDNAGNWSSTASITFVRDMTPPSAVTILPLKVDDRSYLVSNTFAVLWQPPPEPDLAGYRWNLEFLSVEGSTTQNLRSADAFQAAARSSYESAGVYLRDISGISGRGERAAYDNIDDGLWRFSVAPVDEVGNRGEISFVYFRTNKYVPHTFITFVDHRQDFQGDLSMRIIGRGFSRGGEVREIFLTRDGTRDVALLPNQYIVLSDREIDVPLVENLQPGIYSVGVIHPLRGGYETPPLLNIGPSQTIKYGDFTNTWHASWTVRFPRRWIFDAGGIVPYLIIILLLVLAYYSMRGLVVTMREGAQLRMETQALITGTIMAAAMKRQTVKIKLRGISLRIKLALFTTALVVAVVGMVSTPVYILMGNTERETLLQGLWDRSTVLLEGIASNARTFLPSFNVLELSYLPGQSSVLPEAAYITITGHGGLSGLSGDNDFGDYVWATNDPAILQKIDTDMFEPGVSRLTDSLTPRLYDIARELNDRARREVTELASSINDLTQEALSLATRVDEQSQQRFEDIQASTRALETRLTEELTVIGREIGSEPEYSLQITADGAKSFILFKPVLFRQGASTAYFRGLVRLEISIEAIERQIVERQTGLIRVIVLFALAAIFVGFIGAFILATLIIHPLRRLVTHIEFIRDTEDKRKLEGEDIHITTNDELSVLGDTINDMAHGLVKAAQASADLSIGKEIQKKFIPLDIDANQNKLTSGYRDMGNVEFFGYYEGAKGVSGDYFDYLQLDDRYYAIIKCDVAGKGIPAALIMIQVATMFINYFKAWKADEAGTHIEKVVYQINEFIETLGFQGRFAAFSLVLFDSKTGEARFCNAGDNLVHWYDASTGSLRMAALPETPATGVLPNDMVEMMGGYKIQTLTFDAGDILLLYTDGIEEAKRLFRNADFEVVECQEGGAPRDTPHDTHVVGQNGEEIGADRQVAIANAAINRGRYQLYKYHNPEGEQSLEFDYSTCRGTTEDLIMAMVSAEKVFRMYKGPSMGDESRVLVDIKVDAFLKQHFLQYEKYCSRPVPADVPGCLYYLGVAEDEQYDDLTILGVRRKSPEAEQPQTAARDAARTTVRQVHLQPNGAAADGL